MPIPKLKKRRVNRPAMTRPVPTKAPLKLRSMRGTAAASRVSWCFMPFKLLTMERIMLGMEARTPIMPAPAMAPTPTIFT